MKSILVPMMRDEGQEARFQAALDLTRACDGHLTCLHVAPLEQFASIEPYGVSYLLTQSVEQIRDQQKQEQAEYEARLAKEGVNWDWLARAGTPGGLLADHSWLTDLIVMSLPDKVNRRDRGDFGPEDVVIGARAPILAVPEASRGFDPDGRVAIAWNGAPEACAAVKAALPLLRRASKVAFLVVREEDGYDLPPVQAASYLSRHGIESDVIELEKGSAPVSDTLLNGARVFGADCLVMGAYGHSRLRENIFGGVTRGMLDRANMPLFLAH